MSKLEGITSIKNRKKIIWVTLLISSLIGVIAILLFVCPGWLNPPETTIEAVDITEEILCTPVPCEPVLCTPVTEKDPCANRTTPVLYEGEFPGTVDGPAIIEWWDGGPATSEHEGIFKLDAGDESFEWEFYGHFWVFCSQEALETRYPDHMEEFFAK